MYYAEKIINGVLHFKNTPNGEWIEVSKEKLTYELKKPRLEKYSEHSYDIKTEVLQICEAFNLGSYEGMLSFEPSTKVDGFIFTQFETSTGRYNHYFRIKDYDTN